jgi:NDP-sugar pyrophosphorylase family protein
VIETAVVLSAGLGTRMRPMTKTTPKVLFEVGGEPLLFHTLRLLSSHGVRRVCINTHHLGERIRAAAGFGDAFGVDVVYSHEPVLLGSAGAVRALREFLPGRFAVLYGDVLTDVDLAELDRFHERSGATMTLALTHAEDPTRCGVVETASDGRVTGFVEKPRRARSDADVNAGVYVCEPRVLDFIPEGVSDFGSDVIPALVDAGEAVYGMRTNAYFQDIGTPEGYRLARESLSGRRLMLR